MRVLHRLGMRVARAQADVGAQNPLAPGTSPEGVNTLATERLEAEAASEHERLTVARRLAPSISEVREVSPIVERHALVTYSKRRAIRSVLGSGALIVFRSVLADACGHPVACHLTPIRLQLGDRTPWSLQELERLRELLKRDRASNRWLESSLAVHSTFWTTRHARARVIVNHSESPTRDELQPGLFDLRAEHAWADEQERRQAAARERTWLTTASVRAASLTTDSPQIALVLFTR